MNEDFGLTLVRMPAGPIYPDAVFAPLKPFETLAYADFLQWLDEARLYSRAEILEIINSKERKQEWKV